MNDALALLHHLETLLKHEALWSEQPISANAMASQIPFAADVMAFEQWLQFIYLPRLRERLLTQNTLPPTMEVAPAAEVYLPHQVTIINVLRRLDRLASGQA